jgi:hypothetical protein
VIAIPKSRQILFGAQTTSEIFVLNIFNVRQFASVAQEPDFVDFRFAQRTGTPILQLAECEDAASAKHIADLMVLQRSSASA